MDEYAELFKDSKYFNIGGDEFIDFNHFDRFPQLQNYARNVLGIADGTGIDTFIDYTNQVAEHMEKKGFIARIWNDGYFRDNQTERVQLKKSIQINYWTKWDSHMAPVQTFIDEGFKLVNFNDAYFYYVLGENAGYTYPTGAKIYNEWHPGLFPNISSAVKQEYNSPYPAAILGASFAIWSDTPGAQTQDQVSAGVYEPLRAMAEKSWIGEKRYSDYAAFKSVFDQIGQMPGYDRALPTASDIVDANSVGVVYIHAVDEAGQTLYTSRVFGTLGSAYTLTPDVLYGYSLQSLPANASGTFSVKGTTVNLIYNLKTDKTALQQAYDQSAAYPAGDYIAVSYQPYAQQLQQAKAILDDAKATQTTIDSMVSSVKQAQSQLIAMSKMQLYVLIQFPQAQNDAVSSSYTKYLAAIEQAKPLLIDTTASEEDVAAAVKNIIRTMKNVKPIAFNATMYKGLNDEQSIDFSPAFDGKSSTYAMINSMQQVGDTIVFHFAKPMNLSSFTVQYYPDANYGRIKQANFQVAQLVGGSLQWKTVGTLDDSKQTMTLAMNENDVQQARIVYTADSDEYTILNELSFDYNSSTDDAGIQQLRSIDTQSNRIHLQWNPVSGASSYLVYVNDDAQPIYSGSDPSFVHSGLQPNTVYTYRVMSVSNGMTSIPYFVQVKTLELIDTKLSALMIDQGQLSPAFDPSVTAYTANVSSDVYRFGFTVVKHHPLQQLTVTGVTYGSSVTADSYSYQVDIRQPQQSVTIEVYSPNGTGITSMYTLQIVRSATPWFSTKLTGLQIAGGSLTPTFSPDTLSYNVSVGSGVAQTTVTANVYDTSAALTINGQSAISGQAQSIPLNIGANVIPITIKARNGQIQTYTLLVSRQAFSDSGSGSDRSRNSSGSGSSGIVSTPEAPIVSNNGRLILHPSQSGEVRLDNTLLLSIPAGASDSPLIVTMKRLDTSEQPPTNGTVLLSPVYELLKNNPSNFIHPVTLKFTFDPKKIGANETAAIFYYGESSQRWIKVGGTVQGNEITGAVNHFTKFAVMAISKTADAPATEPTVTQPTTQPANSISFSDIQSSWAASNIKRAVALGMVKGYADGTFLPNKPVTRAEFIVMLAHALQLPTSDHTLHFKDQAQIGIWAQPAIRAAMDAKIVKGYPDDRFRPNAIITRAEMASMLAAAIQLNESSNTVSRFADETSIPAWAKASVHLLQQKGIIQGRTGHTFMPQAAATRAEAITIILNLLDASK
ncbi:S-layer homology domain-containing protein [Paenibacillus wenxiniae]|uniref:S-layer homology domain-containing protein n=1 Tax=Paenibacillus wenxiniae TaxID=1636843 RepID=A0ABW4RDX2_9BACL